MPGSLPGQDLAATIWPHSCVSFLPRFLLAGVPEGGTQAAGERPEASTRLLLELVVRWCPGVKSLWRAEDDLSRQQLTLAI